MTILRLYTSRLSGLFWKRRRDADLHAELEEHLDLLTAEHVRSGMPLHDARAAARREFGGVEQMKEAYRDQRGLPFVDGTIQDLRYAFRQLRRHRGFALATLATLMLGIGANTAVFSVLQANSLRTTALPDPDRVAMVWTTPAAHPETNEGVGIREYMAMTTSTCRLSRMSSSIISATWLRSRTRSGRSCASPTRARCE